MVFMRIGGGLGNQMFMYLYGRNIAEKFNLKLKLDLCFPTNGHYAFRLDAFENLHYTIAQTEELYFKDPILGWVTNKVNMSLCERQMRPMGKVHIRPINGFIGEKFFQHIKPSVGKIFQFKPLQSIAALHIREIIREQPLAVAVHIRLGDYISSAASRRKYSVCNRDYYLNAMELMEDKFESPYYFVFSNDIQLCKQFLINKSQRIFFVEGCDTEIEELHLMTLCDHYIIANSTFSWWGAWLGVGADKFVIAPYRWLRDEKQNRKHLIKNKAIPDAWFRLKFPLSPDNGPDF